MIVTGGAGFIGSALIRHLITNSNQNVLNVDALTYAGTLSSLLTVDESNRYNFIRADICDRSRMHEIILKYRPNIIVHLAAETHVDRSIQCSEVFIKANVIGTYSLLCATLDYWHALPVDMQSRFRFHHISTDEVFGPADQGVTFAEGAQYSPRSPYAASKAGSDHLVRSWHHTYGLPVVVTHCSNNYGPYQFPEKLIPRAIINGLVGNSISVFGTGANVRDWLHVDDHVRALERIFEYGRIGDSYTIGARAEQTNLAVVQAICAQLDDIRPRDDGRSYREQIKFVADRPGHDARYAIDPSKLEQELGWRPLVDFNKGLAKTVHWYAENKAWWRTLAADIENLNRV